MSVTLGNADLSLIVNELPGDPIEKRPFGVNFTEAKKIEVVGEGWIYPHVLQLFQQPGGAT